MKVLKEEWLKPATPYMLRNDGLLIDCSPLHPYIKYLIWSDNKSQIELLFNDHFDFLEWFKKNTQHDEVKTEIDKFISAVIRNGSYDINNAIEPKDVVDLSTDDIESMFIELNNEMNQEFCRVRTSNMRFGGTSGDVYFRISSTDFNWFDVIRKLVADNKDFVETVTITTDTQAKGGRPQTYEHNGTKVYQLPTDEFLTLSGNPIIEKDNICKELEKGSSLMEAFSNIHPSHINSCFYTLRKNWINENFTQNNLNEGDYTIDGEEFHDYGTKDITKWSYPDLPYSSEIFDKSTLGGFSAYREYLNDPKYILYITPNEYFEQVAKGRKQTVGQVIRNVEADPEILEHLRNVLLKAKKSFPMPYISRSNGAQQEGLHRIYVFAQMYGWNKSFPCLILP